MSCANHRTSGSAFVRLDKLDKAFSFEISILLAARTLAPTRQHFEFALEWYAAIWLCDSDNQRAFEVYSLEVAMFPGFCAA